MSYINYSFPDAHAKPQRLELTPEVVCAIKNWIKIVRYHDKESLEARRALEHLTLYRGIEEVDALFLEVEQPELTPAQRKAELFRTHPPTSKLA